MPPVNAPINAVTSHRTAVTGKKTFDALTGLRFFAAMGVVLYHFASTIAARGPRIPANLVDSGYVAVSFFYVLSGFVLSYSYVNREGAMLGSRRSFWVARFARIYPAYLLAFLIAAPYNVLWTLRVNHFGTGLLKLLTGAACVLTMQQAWSPWTAWYWNYPAWSVSVEAFFYIAFPFVVPYLRKVGRRGCWLGICGLWAVSMAVPLALWLTRGAGSGTGDRLHMFVEFTPLLRLPEFLIGVLLGRLYVLGFRFRPMVCAMLSYISLPVIVGCLACGSVVPRPLLANGLLAPCFAVLIYSLAEGKGLLARLLAIPTLVLLGEASYGIYILQIPVSYVLRIPPPLNSLAVLAVYVAVLIGVALLSWRFVETPLRQRIRSWLMGSDSRPVAERAGSSGSVVSLATLTAAPHQNR